MKAGTKRFLIELASTAVASPLLLLLLIRMGAGEIVAVIAYPTIPLLRVLSPLLLGALPREGGWFPGLGAAISAAILIVPLWIWILLMILVQLSEVSVKLFKSYKAKRDPA